MQESRGRESEVNGNLLIALCALTGFFGKWKGKKMLQFIPNHRNWRYSVTRISGSVASSGRFSSKQYSIIFRIVLKINRNNLYNKLSFILVFRTRFCTKICHTKTGSTCKTLFTNCILSNFRSPRWHFLIFCHFHRYSLSVCHQQDCFPFGYHKIK
jgi:hypothetical protein